MNTSVFFSCVLSGSAELWRWREWSRYPRGLWHRECHRLPVW